MKKLEKYLIVFAGQVILFGAVVLLTPYPGRGQAPPIPGAPTQNVKVVNTPSEPLPVTGSVNVTNPVTVSGSVNVANPVTVSGSVNVSNPVTVSGTVNVGNTVLFRPALPERAFSVSPSGVSFIFRDEGTTSYAITSLTAYNPGSVTESVTLFGRIANFNQPCEQALFAAIGPTVYARPGETVHLTFPQPYIVRIPGPFACLTQDGDLLLTLVGYKF
jgi:hypothetical protein